MIAYFDTSAVVPLVIEEPTSAFCARVWNEAVTVMSARVMYPEARAALAQARRMRRLTPAQLQAAVRELDALVAEFAYVEITADLAISAGVLAHELGLRGYDAVHLAAAALVGGEDLVLVTGDRDLAAAGRAIGLAVAEAP